jgi:hypothetical protein
LLLAIATCHQLGFGTEISLEKAVDLELKAAQAGSDLGQIKALQRSLVHGVELPISRTTKVEFLRHALGTVCFGRQSREIGTNESKFQAGLAAIPIEVADIGLLHSFIKAYLTEWDVLNLYFNNAAEDPLFGLVVKG